MNRLTLDEYTDLPAAERAAIDAWCLAHRIRPADTFCLRWDGQTVVAEQYRQPLRVLAKRGERAHVATRTRRRRQISPFPAQRNKEIAA